MKSLNFFENHPNKKKRIAWCRGKLHWTVGNQWKKVIFTDEIMIVIKSDGKLKVWRKSEAWRPECLDYVAEGYRVVSPRIPFAP
jgi:hypothetical protein